MVRFGKCPCYQILKRCNTPHTPCQSYKRTNREGSSRVMELNPKQFNEHVRSPLSQVKPLNRHVSQMYPELSAAITLSIKQARLTKLRKEIREN